MLNRWLATLAAWWGVLGVITLLVYAIVRLTPIALEAFAFPFGWIHWAVLLGNVVFMAYSEGYRGFSRSFSPRVARRAAALRECPTPLRAALAPLYCIGYFSAPRSVKISVYALTIGIVVLVQLVHVLDQPWRGILDAGVVVGLLWGCMATFASAFGPLLLPRKRA